MTRRGMIALGLTLSCLLVSGSITYLVTGNNRYHPMAGDGGITNITAGFFDISRDPVASLSFSFTFHIHSNFHDAKVRFDYDESTVFMELGGVTVVNDIKLHPCEEPPKGSCAWKFNLSGKANLRAGIPADGIFEFRLHKLSRGRYHRSQWFGKSGGFEQKIACGFTAEKRGAEVKLLAPRPCSYTVEFHNV